MSYRHLLAINTVTGSCSVAISKGMTLLTQKKVLADKGYSEIIIPLIEKALSEVRLTIDHLDGFLVCTGPGSSYTAVRSSVSFFKALCTGLSKPLAGISCDELRDFRQKNKGIDNGNNSYPLLKKMINKTTEIAIFLAERT